MKITALIENQSSSDALFAQYGLSLFVETASGNILIDAGQDEKAFANFKTLSFREEDIHAIFISHNHYDHIGGLQFFADCTEERAVPIYLSEECSAELYSKTFFTRRMLVSRNDLIRSNASRLVQVDACTEILPSVYACRVSNADFRFVCKDKKLRMLSEKKKLCPDNFSHEIYLAVIEDQSVKIVSSCSHNGIVNIVRDAQKRFGLPVSAFVGGLHMRGNHSNRLNASKPYLRSVIEELNTLEAGHIYTCHCTGTAGFELLKKTYKNEVTYFNTADSFTV